jgi:hypothetical protein
MEEVELAMTRSSVTTPDETLTIPNHPPDGQTVPTNDRSLLQVRVTLTPAQGAP